MDFFLRFDDQYPPRLHDELVLDDINGDEDEILSGIGGGWTSSQLLLLSQAWSYVSDAHKLGISRELMTTESFWKSVQVRFASTGGYSECSWSELLENFRKANRKILTFNAIFDELKQSSGPVGSSLNFQKQLQESLKRYQVVTKESFEKLLPMWEHSRKCPYWLSLSKKTLEFEVSTGRHSMGVEAPKPVSGQQGNDGNRDSEADNSNQQNSAVLSEAISFFNTNLVGTAEQRLDLEEEHLKTKQRILSNFKKRAQQEVETERLKFESKIESLSRGELSDQLKMYVELEQQIILQDKRRRLRDFYDDKYYR